MLTYTPAYRVTANSNSQQLIAKEGRLQADEFARKIVDTVSDIQAEDVLLLDISNVASFADYFVIASGAVSRQIQAIIEAVEQTAKAEGAKPIGREGEPDSGWVLMDYGDVIVHIFAPEERAYYNLEGLWHTATPVVRIQ
jgi:ribosome-associated protein